MKEKITFMDHRNTDALMLITPEGRKVKKQRKLNKYDVNKPTIPFDASMMKFEYVMINGESIRYTKSITGKKETLVLLCPLPQSILAYQPIWKALSKKYNLWAYDLPGFGGSTGGDSVMNFRTQGIFLKDFLDYFDIKTPHLVGPDVGMPAILDYVARYSNDVKSVAVGDGPALSPSVNGSVIDKMVNSSFWRLVFKIVGAGAFVEAGNRLCYMNYTPNPEEISDYKASYKDRIPAVLKWFKDYPQSLKEMQPALDDISTPTLLFWGEDDHLLGHEMAEGLTKVIANSEAHIIKNCGHFSYQDQPREFTDMLMTWVDRHI